MRSGQGALWEWAMAAYARPGVAPACLALQDAHGQNVSYLLWAVWARTADPARLADAAAIARGWDGVALSPLRAARRGLKAAFPGVADTARLRLRDDIKAAELRAERVLLEALEALGPPGSAGPPEVLRAAVRAWGNRAPDKALAALAAALG